MCELKNLTAFIPWFNTKNNFNEQLCNKTFVDMLLIHGILLKENSRGKVKLEARPYPKRKKFKNRVYCFEEKQRLSLWK